jgi:hypothetical protein
MKKGKKSRQTKQNKRLWIILAVVVVALAVLIPVGLNAYNHRDYNWSYYTRQFGLPENATMSEAIEKLGEPANTTEQDRFTRLDYPGFGLGFSGETGDDQILRVIYITDGSRQILRNKVTVGSTLDEMVSAYDFASVMKNTVGGEGGYILQKDELINAIRIYYKYDVNNTITEINLSIGF